MTDSNHPLDNMFGGIEFAAARMRSEWRAEMAKRPPRPEPTRIERVRIRIRRVRYEIRDRTQHAWSALKGERCDW